MLVKPWTESPENGDELWSLALRFLWVDLGFMDDRFSFTACRGNAMAWMEYSSLGNMMGNNMPEPCAKQISDAFISLLLHRLFFPGAAADLSSRIVSSILYRAMVHFTDDTPMGSHFRPQVVCSIDPQSLIPGTISEQPVSFYTEEKPLS